jgi:hypothetical protein
MPDRGPFRYRADVVEALWRHGVHPSDDTRPALVHEFVSDLYRYEIRRLRARLLQQAFPRREYAGRVVELRRRYPVISMPPEEWLEHHDRNPNLPAGRS